MTNPYKKISIKEARWRIIRIFSKMPESEIRKLLKNLGKWPQYKTDDKTEDSWRISGIIDRMSVTEIQNLLKNLKKLSKSKFGDKRKHHRKVSYINASCETNNCNFTDFITNISPGGLFIETGIPLSVNKDIFITFVFPYSKAPTKVTGKMVRADSKGIGVKLYDFIPESNLSNW
jgi:hypothetical protein